jgi:hypothetical protein
MKDELRAILEHFELGITAHALKVDVMGDKEARNIVFNDCLSSLRALLLQGAPEDMAYGRSYDLGYNTCNQAWREHINKITGGEKC